MYQEIVNVISGMSPEEHYLYANGLVRYLDEPIDPQPTIDASAYPEKGTPEYEEIMQRVRQDVCECMAMLDGLGL